MFKSMNLLQKIVAIWVIASIIWALIDNQMTITQVLVALVIALISSGIVSALHKRYSLKDPTQGLLVVIIGALLYAAYFLITK